LKIRANRRNGWGATIIDGLTTLFIAELKEDLVAALDHAKSIDFTYPVGLVNPFETIIR
jgi:mannosyl-oligosaccharide alpha-1,2-mannosidase